MKKAPSEMRPVRPPGLSLEQKIMVLVRRYRAAQKRHKQNEAARSKRLGMAAILALRGLLYERALWLSPADTKAAASLELPTQHAGATAGVSKPFEGAARVLSANTLARMDSAALAPIALGFVAGRLLGPTSGPFVRPKKVICMSEGYVM
jgi:hypothetical protein